VPIQHRRHGGEHGRQRMLARRIAPRLHASLSSGRQWRDHRNPTHWLVYRLPATGFHKQDPRDTSDQDRLRRHLVGTTPETRLRGQHLDRYQVPQLIDTTRCSIGSRGQSLEVNDHDSFVTLILPKSCSVVQCSAALESHRQDLLLALNAVY
jgi:hypothetical protein